MKRPSEKDIFDLFSAIGIEHSAPGYKYIKDFILDYSDGKIDETSILQRWYDAEAADKNGRGVVIQHAIRRAIEPVRRASTDKAREIFGENNEKAYSNKDFLFTLCHYFETKGAEE